MNYEQKYKEALERARDMMSYKEVRREDMEYIFPELKESEGEKMRKHLIDFLRHPDLIKATPTIVKNCIAWLEKQDKQKLYVNDNAKEMFIRALERVEEQNSKGYKLTDCDKNSWWEDFKTYTSEQNLTNSEKTCKVEPKFKVGDWVIDKQGIVHQISNVIENVTNHTYGYDIVGGGYFNDNTEGVRLWTIQDAKDGDVLHSPSHHLIWIYKNSVQYHACVNTNYAQYYDFDTNGWLGIPKDVFPATKDEQTILFERIKRAGYEWDADEKELIEL